MRILYLSNYHNPYRDEFFEQLGLRGDLTVLFEQKTAEARDSSWFSGISAQSYKELYLPEHEQSPLSPTMRSVIDMGWSLVIVGCYNSPKQIAAIRHMRRKGIPDAVNSDGPLFDAQGIKAFVRRHILYGADAYFVAGESSISSMRREIGGDAAIVPYPFSSLTESRVSELAARRERRDEGLILLVGQFLPYKGIDVALDALLRFSCDTRIRLVGTGPKTREAEEYIALNGMRNVEVVPFLKSEDLVEEYLHANLFILPSRKECWGLVVNEAAACGCPVVSTWGSGAAIEFLADRYPFFLAKSGDANSLAEAIRKCLLMEKGQRERYQEYLRHKSSKYTIEAMVDAHVNCLRQCISKKGGLSCAE